LDNKPFRVLCVCLGNICRSPTAEAMLRHLAAREAPLLKIEIDSAGTADYHVGAAPDPRSQRAALRRGIDISGLRARQVREHDFTGFDLIVAMDRANLRELESMKPATASAQLRLFMAYAPGLEVLEVPDPYYGGCGGFEQVLDLVAAASRGLLAELQGAQQPV
jgi:protein-tyrosine phosphatase